MGRGASSALLVCEDAPVCREISENLQSFSAYHFVYPATNDILLNV
jgi:hypothetical protein